MSTGAIGIQVTTQPVVVAPAPIWLEATNPTGFEDEAGNPIAEPTGGEAWDPTYHKITYIWTVEEETSPGVWTQMSGSYPRVINMVTPWNKAYTAYGKRVAFRLPDTGTYRFRCWCVDMQGHTGEATSQAVTVQSAEAAYSAAETIAVAADGDFTGAPAAANQVTSLSALNALLQSATGPRRISFKPGETHEGTIDAADGSCDHVGTWVRGSPVDLYAPRGGIGGRSFLGHFRMNDGSTSQQCTFEDIRFMGDWDDTTETGDNGDAAVFEVRYCPEPTKFLCYNCDFRGIGTVQITLGDPGQNGAQRDSRWMFADCICTSFKNYGFYSYFCNGGEYDFLGTSAYRSHDALHGPDTGAKQQLRNDHGAVRLTSYQHCYMACSDFFNNAGWSAAGPPIGPSNNGTIRLFAGIPTTPEVPSLNVDRCIGEGGYCTWKLDGQDSAAPEVPGNWLFDKVLTLCTARTHHPWNIAMGGITRRNCYTWAPLTEYWDRSGGFDRFLRFETDGSATTSANYGAPMLDYNNTDLSLDNGNQIPLSDGHENQWALFARENSINHQPNAGTSVTTFAPINTETASEVVPGVQPRFSGVRYNYALIQVQPGTIPNGGTISIPYASLDSTDGLGRGDTTPTTQAYWQALPASDTLHALAVDGSNDNPFRADRGDFTVSYSDPTNIIITNTSGVTWAPSNGTIYIHLDRKSRLQTDIPPLTQYGSPNQVPLPRPLAGSPAHGAADIGYVAYDDFLGHVRSTPKTAGAIEA